MKQTALTLLASLLLPTAALAYDYQPPLEPPNATVYAEALSVHSDFDNFGGDVEAGFRARLGMQMNDIGPGRWRWRVEGGFNQFGEGSADRITSEVGGFAPPVFERQTLTREDSRLTGFEFGGRLYDGELFYVRGGAYLYNLKTSRDIIITDLDVNGNVVDRFALPPESESDTSISPYIGAGIEYPVLDQSIKLVLEYNRYRIESERFDNIGAGIQLTF